MLSFSQLREAAVNWSKWCVQEKKWSKWCCFSTELNFFLLSNEFCSFWLKIGKEVTCTIRITSHLMAPIYPQQTTIWCTQKWCRTKRGFLSILLRTKECFIQESWTLCWSIKFLFLFLFFISNSNSLKAHIKYTREPKCREKEEQNSKNAEKVEMDKLLYATIHV